MKSGIKKVAYAEVTIAATGVNNDVFASLGAGKYWVLHHVSIDTDVDSEYVLHFEGNASAANVISAGFLNSLGGKVETFPEEASCWSVNAAGAPTANLKIQLDAVLASSTRFRIKVHYTEF